MDPTVFRKLAELPYRTSYSHRGRYYTWDEAARFDDLGLWCFGSVWFSTYGTLLPTVAALVEASEADPLREPRRALKARDGRYNAQVLRLGWKRAAKAAGLEHVRIGFQGGSGRGGDTRACPTRAAWPRS